MAARAWEPVAHHHHHQRQAPCWAVVRGRQGRPRGGAAYYWGGWGHWKRAAPSCRSLPRSTDHPHTRRPRALASHDLEEPSLSPSPQSGTTLVDLPRNHRTTSQRTLTHPVCPRSTRRHSPHHGSPTPSDRSDAHGSHPVRYTRPKASLYQSRPAPLRCRPGASSDFDRSRSLHASRVPASARGGVQEPGAFGAVGAAAVVVPVPAPAFFASHDLQIRPGVNCIALENSWTSG